MVIAVLTVRLYAPWVHSLKQKRSELKGLLHKIKDKFNVSAAETADQDVHQSLVISIAAIAANSQLADSMLEHIERFIEENTDAEITGIEREYR